MKRQSLKLLAGSGPEDVGPPGRSVRLPVCPSLPIRLSLCLSACLSLCMSVCLSLCLSFLPPSAAASHACLAFYACIHTPHPTPQYIQRVPLRPLISPHPTIHPSIQRVPLRLLLRRADVHLRRLHGHAADERHVALQARARAALPPDPRRPRAPPAGQSVSQSVPGSVGACICVGGRAPLRPLPAPLHLCLPLCLPAPLHHPTNQPTNDPLKTRWRTPRRSCGAACRRRWWSASAPSAPTRSSSRRGSCGSRQMDRPPCHAIMSCGLAVGVVRAFT